MKTEHDDSLTQALALLELASPGQDHAPAESSGSSVAGEIGELFLADLRGRRERLRRLIRLLSEEARSSRRRAPAVQASRHKCGQPEHPPRGDRRLGAPRRSTIA